MPAICKCPKCGFNGAHGFSPTNGGLMLYHHKQDGSVCKYYAGDDGNIYSTHLDLFKAVTIPRARQSRDPGVESWIKARIAELTGHPRIAKKHYDAWNRANNNF
jgi:hypothetical protein